MPSIPPVDKQPDEQPNEDGNQRSEKLERLELKVLQLEEENYKLKNKESFQRYILRWAVFSIGVVMLIFFACTLAHLVHRAFFGPFLITSGAFSVTMIAAPTLAMTSITIALFVAAFRKFDETDIEKASATLKTAASAHRTFG